MEDNRKFATFFADAPKGKKIGAVLSWIATVILLVALFVPGYQLRYQIKTEKGTFKDMQAVRRGTTARFLNPISKNQIQNACWAVPKPLMFCIRWMQAAHSCGTLLLRVNAHSP